MLALHMGTISLIEMGVGSKIQVGGLFKPLTLAGCLRIYFKYDDIPSPFYTASVVLSQLHGCVVGHMKALATPLLSVNNIKYSFCWILTTESI